MVVLIHNPTWRCGKAVFDPMMALIASMVSRDILYS